jgi:hypothetical protein
MESRLIFRHHWKALKLSITQVAKVGEAISWLLQGQTPSKLGENELRPKSECNPCENGEAITAKLTRKVLCHIAQQCPYHKLTLVCEASSLRGSR